jgi:hypothetical protein
MKIPFITCQAAACVFPDNPTFSIIIFEFAVIIITLISLLAFHKNDKKILAKYGSILLGVFLFDFFTHPMWDSYNMGWWSYVYRDVSWILSINLATLILLSIKLTDNLLKKGSEGTRFVLSILFMIPFVWFSEWLIIKLGIRGYSPEVQAIMPSKHLFNVPIGALYYIPAYTGLLIGFYKYWEFRIKNKPVIPSKKPNWLTGLAISFVTVFLFEIMVEPMVQNTGMPRWSYIYRDISFLLSGLWVLVIYLSIYIVDRMQVHYDLIRKFIAYIVLGGFLMLPIESYLMHAGIRVYGPSSVMNFSGYMIPFFNVPAEIFFATPFYLALVIATIKYWQFVIENRKKA